jgi:hypothetical protein
MRPALSAVVAVVVSAWAVCCVSARVTSRSLSKFSPAGWETVGDAFASTQLVRLVPDRQSRQGGYWNTEPVLFRDWEVTYALRVHGVSAVGADGLGFWYVRDYGRVGPLFGNEDLFTGLGILLDTYDNANTVSTGGNETRENFFSKKKKRASGTIRVH